MINILGTTYVDYITSKLVIMWKEYSQKQLTLHNIWYNSFIMLISKNYNKDNLKFILNFLWLRQSS